MITVDIEKLGKKYRVQVPDEAAEELWQYGIVLGPPDLSSLGLPPSIEVRLHNELHVRGLITREDLARRSPADIVAAIQSALKLDAQGVIALYQ